MYSLQEYSKRITDLGALVRQPSQLVPYLAHYLDEECEGEPTTPKALHPMFEELRVRPPGNLSDVLRRSKMFVRASAGGYRLSHDGQQMVLAGLTPRPIETVLEQPKKQPTSKDLMRAEPSTIQFGATIAAGSHVNNRDVLVVYGRDQKLRQDLFSLLWALNLHPLEFEEMAQQTGSTAPYTLEVLQTAFRNVQACVVLLSPDETVLLRKNLREPGDSDEPQSQPRPNVLIEAGMAVALQPTRTILVRVGDVRTFSDFDGKQYVNLTGGSAQGRNKLLNRLRLAGCDVKSHGDDWLTVGDFNIMKEDGQ